MGAKGVSISHIKSHLQVRTLWYIINFGCILLVAYTLIMCMHFSFLLYGIRMLTFFFNSSYLQITTNLVNFFSNEMIRCTEPPSPAAAVPIISPASRSRHQPQRATTSACSSRVKIVRHRKATLQLQTRTSIPPRSVVAASTHHRTKCKCVNY